jgi:hypothetical protein
MPRPRRRQIRNSPLQSDREKVAIQIDRAIVGWKGTAGLSTGEVYACFGQHCTSALLLASRSGLRRNPRVSAVSGRHFIASLSPVQRERLKGFEAVRGDWREFRDLLQP